MLAKNSQSVIEQAKGIYQAIRLDLEAKHPGCFVAIEPVSGEIFIEKTFDSAVDAARRAYPDRVSHTIRIGHKGAFHIGLMT